jgi:hypothetical protein
MRTRKRQFLIYLEIDRNEAPEKIENIIRYAFRDKKNPRIRTLLTAINYRNLTTTLSQPLILTGRELNGEIKQKKVD